MPYPNVLYHYEKRGEPLYQNHPPGVADVNRLIKSLPYWLSPNLTSVQIPKKLIYADWTHSCRSDKEVKKVEELTTQLILDGFEIYIWEDKKVKPYREKMLAALTRQQIIPLEEIIEVAVETYQLSPDEICIVDDYLFKILLGEINELDPRYISISKLSEMELTGEDFLTLLKTSKEAHPPFQGIHLDEYSDPSIEFQSEDLLGGLWTDLNVITDYHKIILDVEDYTRLISGIIIVYDHLNLSLDMLGNVSSLQLNFENNEVNPKDLQILFDKLPKLTFLKFHKCIILSDDTSSFDITTVAKIEFSESTISAKELELFLASGANLKEVYLSDIKLIDNFTKNSVYPQLNTLHLDFDIDAANAKKLLHNSPNLRSLMLTPYLAIELNNDLPSEMLTELSIATPIQQGYQSIELETLFSKKSPKLERLNFNRIEFNGGLSQTLTLENLKAINFTSVIMEFEPFQKIIENSINLQSLTVEDCVFDSYYILPNNLILPNLDTLTISRTDIYFENIAKLLRHSQQLKELNVHDLAFLSTEEEKIDPLVLPSLETLKLANFSGLNANQLETLLVNASGLRSFSLRNDEDISGNFTQKIELPNLEMVDFENSLSTPFMMAVLKGASNLSKLSIKSCSSFYDTSPEDLNFVKLSELTLETTRLSTLFLQKLLDKNHFLTSLVIRECYDADFCSLALKKFPNLVSLSIELQDISISSLKNVTHAGKLQILNLTRCKVIEDIEDGLSFPKLKEINLEESSITWTFLQKLLTNNSYLKKLNLNESCGLEDNIPSQEIVLPFLKKLQLNKVRNAQEILAKLTSHANISLIDIDPINLGLESKLEEDYFEDPIHDPEDHREFKPTPKDAVFEFKGLNHTKNQGMIIEKLSQYLTLREINLFLIPKIQDGICLDLSALFSYKSIEEWQNFLNTVEKWDGDKESITSELQILLDELCTCILSKKESNEMYIGDALPDYLTQQVGSTLILNNPWHAIALRFLPQEELWYVYDPNSITGGLKISSNELFKRIADSVGAYISINTNYAVPEFKINPDLFIQNGGLIFLSRCKNSDDLLQQLSQHREFSDAALTGLLLRDTKGTPLWVQAFMNTKTTSFSLFLLRQFTEKNSQQYIADLKNSLEAISSTERLAFIECLCATNNNDYLDLIQILYQIVSEPIHKNRFNETFSPWKSSKMSEVKLSSALYYQQLVQPNNINKRLVQFTSSQDLAALQLGFESFCRSIKRPVFSINSTEDLSCSAPFIERRDNMGFLRKGPGGQLYDFIQVQNQVNQAAIIIVNYDRFEAADIVRFNSLLDDDRRVDGITIPQSIIIVGLINTSKPGCYQGEDFYSRFNKVEVCPLLSMKLSEVPTYKMDEHKHVEIINLYHGTDWEDQILGRWVLENGNEFSFVEGKLHSALQKSHTICFQNGLWSSDKFKFFWQQAQIRGFIEHAGRIIQLPSDFKLLRHEGYDWKRLNLQCNWFAGEKSEAHIVNPSLFSHYIDHYQFDAESQMLRPNKGILFHNKGQILHVNVTRNLNEDNWAQLLDSAKAYQVSLVAHCSSGVSLPDAMNIEFKVQNPVVSEWKGDLAHPTMVIQSSDVDTTVAMLKSIPNKNWLVIDVSECKSEDLLTKIQSNLNEEEVRLEFQQIDCVITKALNNNHHVILKGKFKIDLIDCLAPLILQRMNTNPKNNLLLVAPDAAGFSYVDLFSHTVRAEDKLRFLWGNIYQLNGNLLDVESLSRLQTRLNYSSRFPELPSDNAWAGLNSLPNIIGLQNFDPSNSKKIADEFIRKRLNGINNILKYSPYVYITGLTATGKSTFVETYLAKDKELYHGESRMKAWALDHSEGKDKILFIDEANLSEREWSELEGMYNIPPGIVIDGQYCPLTDKHKVVFAGNPASYSSDRKISPFFERHGNAFVFEPMPLEFIFEYILKPVFEGTALAGQELALSEPILKVYQFLCQCSTDIILITPRELQMMALLIISTNNYQNYDLANYFARDIGRRLVPSYYQADFDELFPPVTQPDVKFENLDDTSYCLTPSKEPVYQLLINMFKVSAYKKLYGKNDAQRFGGINCVVLEGDSGVGKSELVIAALRAYNYKEFNLNSKIQAERVFCRVPVSMELSAKKALLEKAVNVGAVIIIDEINSSPMMERFLNDLLMSKLFGGKRPEVPGAVIIGTQNPVTMAGRLKPPSNAWSRRVITETVLPYCREEIITILIKNKVPLFIAKLATDSFLHQQALAIHDHLKPKPTFRDLLRFVKIEIEANLNLLWLYETPLIKQVMINDPIADEESKSVDIMAEDFFNNCFSTDCSKDDDNSYVKPNEQHKRMFFSNNNTQFDQDSKNENLSNKKIKAESNSNSVSSNNFFAETSQFGKRKHSSTSNELNLNNTNINNNADGFGFKRQHL